MLNRFPGRIVIALGGNAIAGADGSAEPAAQQAAVELAMDQVADLVAGGWEVVLTHGNGPQVGNLLRKNQIARDVVPSVPLDWCVAQTQATMGYLIVTALEQSLAERGLSRHVACVLTRVLTDEADPAWTAPIKPIGGYADEAAARAEMARGEHWAPFGDRGWRRLVPSPDPLAVLDAEVIQGLVEQGTIVVAGGGGGVPMVRGADGRLRGVEAVLDKDLSGALLARAVAADVFVIATDVAAAAIRYGTADQRWLGQISAAELEALAADGEFAAGSMGPKVEAALRFVRAGGALAAITSLDHLGEAALGEAGTVIETRTTVL
jgi:carbamate kinase